MAFFWNKNPVKVEPLQLPVTADPVSSAPAPVANPSALPAHTNNTDAAPDTSAWKSALKSSDRFLLRQCQSSASPDFLSKLGTPESNRYEILNTNTKTSTTTTTPEKEVEPEPILYAVEVGCWARCLTARFCFGTGRPYRVQIYDKKGKLVLTVKQPCSVFRFCFGSNYCGNSVMVVTEEGAPQQIGIVTQACMKCPPKYTIKLSNPPKITSHVEGNETTTAEALSGTSNLHLQPAKGESRFKLWVGNPTFQILNSGTNEVLGEISGNGSDRSEGAPCDRDRDTNLKKDEEAAGQAEQGEGGGAVPERKIDRGGTDCSEDCTCAIFPQNLDDENKIMLLGATFMLYFLYHDPKNGRTTILDLLFYTLFAALVIFGIIQLTQ